MKYEEVHEVKKVVICHLLAKAFDAAVMKGG